METDCKAAKVSGTPAFSACRVPAASTRVSAVGVALRWSAGEDKTVTLSVLAYAMSSRLPL